MTIRLSNLTFKWKEKKTSEETKEEMSPFSSITIETGARHYGLPPDAKERRM